MCVCDNRGLGCARGLCLFMCERETENKKRKRQRESVCVCACVCVRVCVGGGERERERVKERQKDCVCVIEFVCVCEGVIGQVVGIVYAYICNITHRHIGREVVQRVRGRTHDNDDFVDFPNTL